MPIFSRRSLGQCAEYLASAYLKRKGLKLLQHNYRCKLGEIDLIMQDKQSLVFVEVRYRKSSTCGGAAASITTEKQRKIRLAARHYLLHHKNLKLFAVRFDVVTIEGNLFQKPFFVWIKQAFY